MKSKNGYNIIRCIINTPFFLQDDHGQSTLHFAASRTHGRNGLYQLLKDMDCNIALRDELYRTARDVAMQINLPENVIAIDRYVVYLAANGANRFCEFF